MTDELSIDIIIEDRTVKINTSIFGEIIRSVQMNVGYFWWSEYTDEIEQILKFSKKLLAPEVHCTIQATSMHSIGVKRFVKYFETIHNIKFTVIE